MRITPLALLLLSLGPPAAVATGYYLRDHVNQAAHAGPEATSARHAAELDAFRSTLRAAEKEQDSHNCEKIEAFLREYTRKYQEAAAHHDEAQIRRLNAIAQQFKGLDDDPNRGPVEK
jgi:hypothetical protein